MRATAWLQVARIPVLIGLLLSTGPLLTSGARAAVRVETEGVLQVWWWLVAVAAVFVAVALVGRRRGHPTGILVLEGLVAAVLGTVPPVQWLVWFGINPFTEAAGGTSGLMAPMQPLSIAWLGIVVWTARSQARRPHRTEPAPAAGSVSG